LCCYSCPSLGEETWRKTLTDLSSVDKNEIPCVKEQRSKTDNGNDFVAVERWLCMYGNEKFKMFVLTNTDFSWQMKVHREVSFNFSLYGGEYLVCRREIYLLVDNNM